MRTLEKPEALSLRQSAEEFTIKRTFEVITPVLGGGVYQDPDRPWVKPIDPITPIRSASIRGHLRWWWRLLYADGRTGAALRDAEGAIWGLASKPGAVSLEVSYTGKPELVEVFDSIQSKSGKWNPTPKKGREGVGYGAYSLQHNAGQDKRTESGTLWRLPETAQLLARITCANEHVKDIHEQVSTTIDTWLLFGGIGARTRRGFGAVSAKMGHPSPPRGLRLQVSPAKYASADEALEKGLGALRQLRQGVGLGRNQGKRDPKRPGRSRWPEADTIRAFMGRSSDDHKTPLTTVQKFPRAALGLPINFHFKDRNQGDPNDVALAPPGKGGKSPGRMASPVILRPFKRGQNDFGVLALVLPSAGTPPQLVPIANKTTAAELTPNEQAAISPLRLSGNAANAIDALLYQIANLSNERKQ